METQQTQKPMVTAERFEAVRRRNYIAFMGDGFFFNFSSNLFSTATVLPAFVATMSDNNFHISLLSALFFGISYLMTVVACFIGNNAKSPKKTYFWIAFSQRFGFLTIFFSALTIGKLPIAVSLTLFFVSFSIFAGTNGMTGSLFSQLVSVCFDHGIGDFYGNYTALASVAGVLSSLFLTGCFRWFVYPYDYAVAFLGGTVMALFSSLSIAAGVREVLDDYRPAPIAPSEFLPRCKAILAQNKPYLRFCIVYLLMSAADFSRSYYIVKLTRAEGASAEIVGVMTTVLLLASIVGSKLIGIVGDRRGPLSILAMCCGAGAFSSLLALVLPSAGWGYVLFVVSALAGGGFFTGASLAVTLYSGGRDIPLYNTLSKLLAAPFGIVVPLLGAAAANRFGNAPIFLASLGIYALAAALALFYSRAERSGPLR